MASKQSKSILETKERIKNQITNGCAGSLCTGIFCKISDIDGMADEIVELLAEYGDYFTCESLYFVHRWAIHEAEKESKNSMRMKLHPNMSTTHLPKLESIPDVCLTAEQVKKIKNKVLYSMARSVLKYFYLSVRSNGHFSQITSPFIDLVENLYSPTAEACGLNFEALHGAEKKTQKEYLKMELARIIHKKKLKETAIMLQGLFYHKLNKLKESYTVHTTVQIVKLFNAVKENVKFEKKYFIRFLEAIEKLHKAISAENILCMRRCHKLAGGLSYDKEPRCGFKEEEEFPAVKKCIPDREISAKVLEECSICSGSLEDCYYPHCDALCYCSNKLCVNELIDLIKSLIIVIDNTSVINMREGTLLLAILKSLKGLHILGVETGIIHHSLFINTRFSRHLNYKLEIKYHKEGISSIFDYPFILDMESKSDLIDIENTDRMKTELQNAFFRSLFEGKIPPYLTIEVNRETVVQDSLKLLGAMEEGVAWKQLKIKFLGEPGVDSGGIKKEFFQLLSQKMLGEWDLFKEEDGVLWFNMFSKEEIKARANQYRILGSILGLAAYNGAVLCFYFPQIFYKRLLGYSSTLEDLKKVEPKIYKTLSEMKKMLPDEIKALCLEYTLNGVTYEVTSWNLGEFIEVYSKDILEVRLETAFELIKDGLWSICGNTFIKSLLPCELSILIGGMECLNMDEVERYAMYSGGYQYDSKYIKTLWNIFKGYDIAMKKKFLRFVTGTDRAPSGGMRKMVLTIMRNGGDTDRLPSSQTCFNTILIPEYSNAEKLKQKLDLAISHTEGFFLL